MITIKLFSTTKNNVPCDPLQGIRGHYSSSSSSSSVQKKCKKCRGSSAIVPSTWRVCLVLFHILLLVGGSLGCGPGRGAGRRRAPRKLTPLVYKQHVPNVPENTLHASGLNEGRITRGNSRFKNLVPNYNQDIIFRDDEGSGADRLMTQRCKEKLNTLAISVMNQWPGIKLRVIEGWDEENLHLPHSLHYEGRAVDINTSDKDRSKYGMLARLAVEAGFDWVYYESRGHIHCSVKPDSAQGSRKEGCFSMNSTVQTPSGPRKISEIRPGDQVLAIDSSGNQVFSDVLLFLDRNDTERTEFYEIQTASGKTITLTPSRMIYTIQPETLLSPQEASLLDFNSSLSIIRNQTDGSIFLNRAVISFARNVQVGDWVLVVLDDKEKTFRMEKVVDMSVQMYSGVYAPLTAEGNIVVDGILSSCYAMIEDQSLDHWAFVPVRVFHNFLKTIKYIWTKLSHFVSFSSSSSTTSLNNNSNNNEIRRFSKDSFVNTNSREEGIHWYARSLYTISHYLLPSHLTYGD